MKKYKSHIAWLFLILAWFALGIGSEKIISWELFRFWNKNIEESYSYINSEILGSEQNTKYIPFELKTSKRIFEEVESINPDISLSVYVRNLNNWPWFGIHEDEKFASIGILKMPLFLAYLKWSDQKYSAVLEKTHTIEGNVSYTMNGIYSPKNTLQEGRSYTVTELLREMMVNSNETATKILRENIPESYLKQVYSELGLTLEWNRQMTDDISLKEYSSFFRILYNAAYLTPKTSEFALSLLTETDFKEGIVYWVPASIQVANKFWERVYQSPTGGKTYQIHDCGVVYYKKYPYMICIASRGVDEKKLANTIGETSRIVYEEISRAYPLK